MCATLSPHGDEVTHGHKSIGAQEAFSGNKTSGIIRGGD